MNLFQYFGVSRKQSIYDNQSISSQLLLYEEKKHSESITQMKMVLPNLSISDDDMNKLSHKAVSIHQAAKNRNGQFLESLLRQMLVSENIPFQEQVTINQEGNIVDSSEKRRPCYHILDFVIGEQIIPGRNIREYTVLSCKTTCRERWTQDNWTLRFPPQQYFLITTSNDYPNSERFHESGVRKMITCNPKRYDERIYKLNFQDLISELTQYKN